MIVLLCSLCSAFGSATARRIGKCLSFMGLLWVLPALAQEQSASIGGQDRTWILHMPPGGATGRPLVVALHGGGGTAAGFDRATQGQLTREATRRRWGLVFPQGIEKGWNDGRTPVSGRDERRAQVDDVAFLDALLDRLLAQGFDPVHVYFTGISNGGLMSQRYALDRAEKVAAIAPVAANAAEAWIDRRPQRPVPVIFLLGSEDPLMPYAGGQVTVFGSERGLVRSGPLSARHWADLDGCPGEPTREALADRAPDDDTHVSVDRFPCPAGTAVELWTLEGAGHTWPLGRQYLPKRMIGRVSREVDGAGVIFDFFARFKR